MTYKYRIRAAKRRRKRAADRNFQYAMKRWATGWAANSLLLLSRESILPKLINREF